MTTQHTLKDKVPCNCPKGGMYELDNGSTRTCEKCYGTEWLTSETSIDKHVYEIVKSVTEFEHTIRRQPLVDILNRVREEARAERDKEIVEWAETLAFYPKAKKALITFINSHK